MNKSNFNMIEAITSGSESTVINTLNQLGISSMSKYFYMNGGPILNKVGNRFVPCIIYLDKDGNISNLSYYSNNDQLSQIIRQIGNTTSR